VRLLFLDVDGVLVLDWDWRTHLHGNARPDPACIAALNHIIDSTGCYVVVSSSWRKERSLQELCQIINGQFGVHGQVIGRTEVLTVHREIAGCATPVQEAAGRGEEILKWLQAYARKHSVHSFAILDDSADVGELDRFLVRPDSAVGLTMQDAAQAVAILNR